MLRVTEVRVALDYSEAQLKAAAAARLGIAPGEVLNYRIRRRGYDARNPTALGFIFTLDVEVRAEPPLLAHGRATPTPDETYRYPYQFAQPPVLRPVVIGTGPCGVFAALSLARMGLRPIVLERGKAVRPRTKDVWAFWRRREFNAQSNVQFGEGGAGTFSDGKLHSGIKDRGHHGKKILADFVAAGAPPEIVYISKPHIGTFKLVKVVENLRAEIIALGGEVRFESHVTDVAIDDGAVRAVTLVSGERIDAAHIVLALGHSARDTFEMLHRRGVYLEPKPFSVGFRLEHPQRLIDACRLGPHAGHPALGAADYKLVHHARNGRTAYSFCMCPGGQVVAATSEPGRVVTNGMSTYSRDQDNANSGIVVDVMPTDFGSDHPLAGIAFQRKWEERAFVLGGSNYNAPAQRLGDFLAARASKQLGGVRPSYQPGVTPTDLSSSLPAFVIDAIREALPAFERDIKGYALPDAVLTGVEVRTSSPVRITRTATYESVNVRGLYPAGEGAGYAGGIFSAAVDGMKVAEAVARDIATRTRQTS